MQKITLLFFILITSNLYSFFLMTDNPPRYVGDTVKVRVMSEGCANIGLGSGELATLAQNSLDKYWNTVSTASIKFDVDGSVNLEPDLTVLEIVALVPPNEIVIACSNNEEEFSSTTLAKGGMQSDSQGRPQGVVVLNNTADSIFNSLSDDQINATFSHEFGHTMGIGHSNIEYALMYYAVDEEINQQRLSEDDVDAITYLYPNESQLGGVLGSCGTISDINSEPPGGGPLSMIVGFFLSAVIIRSISRSRLVASFQAVR